MPLEWTHEQCNEPECRGTTACASFPTFTDRIAMARAAYGEYAEADCASVIDFALDVLLFAQAESPSDTTLLPRLAKQARREFCGRARRPA